MEVRPRFQDPDVRVNISPANTAERDSPDHKNNVGKPTKNEELVPGQTSKPTKGLFTSLQDNKMIVLIIVIVIIIIGILAYILFKKDTNGKKKTPPSGGGAPQSSRQDLPPRMQQANVNPQNQQNVSHANPPANLMQMLAKGRGVQKQEETAQPQTQPPQEQGVRTNDEIMQLMEDESEHKNTVADTSDGSNESASSSFNNVTDTSAHEDNTGISTSQIEEYSMDNTNMDNTANASPTKPTCSQILTTGRKCRNIAGPNGKCRTHQG